jgi:oligopeptidase A
MTEVVTLFHEFGHALQHMLTKIDEPQASGINGVEWDAVEIASQFMENWCYDRMTLKSISEHIETGEELPDELFEKIVNAKNYLSATAMMRQLFLGATDMDLYSRYPDPKWSEPNDVKCENAAKYLFPLVQEDRYLCSFSHIFGGGYSAGYYSYKWSEVLSADCFAAFEEAGLGDAGAIHETGLRMRRTIMGQGGGMPPMEVFKAFRGREPNTDALLRHSGLR